MASVPQLTELDRMTGQISKRSKCGSLGEKVLKSEINFIGKPVAWCCKSDVLDNQMIYQYNNSISIQFHTVVSTEQRSVTSRWKSSRTYSFSIVLSIYDQRVLFGLGTNLKYLTLNQRHQITAFCDSAVLDLISVFLLKRKVTDFPKPTERYIKPQSTR